ncbi:fasciclin domain-containing protein [uncultured Pseudokineococcus sp.]|uniref:fasciclin domain-containing protein n=1 Tax=uncultured Pseudokineococcus sp. TaxID=1642928 RepID=UPI0026282BD3|nr:fasciclin domain-containing protein [uncultured Pseudokineococcus sp.]
MKRSRTLAATAGAAALALSLVACGSDEPVGGTEDAVPDPSLSAPTATPSEGMSGGMETGGMETGGMETGGMSGDMDPAAMLVGPGCGDYAEANPEGAGSVDGMAQDPVATAAGNNPLLTQLTAAVSGQLNPEVDLVDDLNGAEDITVFAPVDEAFAALDQATLDTLGSPEGAQTLTDVLTYHVVTTPVDPQAPEGDYDTLVGEQLSVTGSGDDITVDADGENPASVVCGGVQTANATVYLVDAVLMPSGT